MQGKIATGRVNTSKVPQSLRLREFSINITMQSYSGEISLSQEATIGSVVDSAVFDTPPQIAETSYMPTSSFIYTDPETKTNFTVPANWVETPLSEEGDILKVQFSSLKETGLLIQYGYIDAWELLTASERFGYSRADFDNSFLRETAYFDAYELGGTEISLVNYDGIEYYGAIGTFGTEAYGTTFSYKTTQMIHVSNFKSRQV